MDNLIEIIVLFFIIYSILNTILAAKKPNKKTSENNEHKLETNKTNEKNAMDFDTLEEVFGFKIPKNEDKYPYSEKEEGFSLETVTWDPEKEFKEKIKQKERIEKELPNIDFDKLQSLESLPLKKRITEESNIYEMEQKRYERLASIRNKLKNPQTIKDLFLISEILNKPKALRK